jgi:hypothetical protein
MHGNDIDKLSLEYDGKSKFGVNLSTLATFIRYLCMYTDESSSSGTLVPITYLLYEDTRGRFQNGVSEPRHWFETVWIKFVIVSQKCRIFTFKASL